MEVNFRKGLFHCWRCNFGKGLLLPALFKYLKIDTYRDWKYLIKEKEKQIDFTTKELTIPGQFKLSANGMAYLEKRGMTPFRAFQLKCCSSTDWRLKNRVIIPLMEGKRIVCYAARSINGQEPKELFPEARISNKANFLYNIDEVECGDRVIIVEGIFDCEVVRQAGYKCISILGSNMSEVQIGKLLSRKPRNITLFFDGDEPGKRATFSTYLSITPRYNWSITRAICPDGKDPKDLTTQELKEILN